MNDEIRTSSEIQVAPSAVVPVSRHGWSIFVRQEGGFTTPAAAVALLLVLSLLFMCVDGFRVGTRAGQIQYVADAGALAADNVVAEFVTAGQVVDAVLLTFSLFAVTVYAISFIAGLIPGGQGVAATLTEFSTSVVSARNKFAKSAIKCLDSAQKALPALCAVRAAQVVQANAEASGQQYYGIAITCPFKGVTTGIEEDEETEKNQEDAEEGLEEEREKVSGYTAQREAEEREAKDAKEDAWRADCGAGPQNMQERAEKLAHLPESINPKYATVDTWRFSVGLNRAKAYYQARYAKEPGISFNGEPREVSKSVARKAFYRYALARVSGGYIKVSKSGGESPHLKKLAVGKEELKGTFLYTEPAYPLSRKDGVTTLHAYNGCPECTKESFAGVGALKGIEEGTYAKCKTCAFSLYSIHKASSISTKGYNGFESCYQRFVDAANRYRTARKNTRELREKTATSTETATGKIKDLLRSFTGQRYSPQPPGRYGCICIVVSPEQKHAGLPFLGGESTTPARIAISGATLAHEDSSFQNTVIADIAAGLIPKDVKGSAVLRTVIGSWGDLLQVYSNADGGIDKAINAIFGAVPVVGDDLASAASDAFKDAIEEVGLQPGNLNTYKPVLVNTSEIAQGWSEKGGSAAANAILALKEGAELYSEGTEISSAVQTEDLKTVLNTLSDCKGFGNVLSSEGLTLATVPVSSLFEGGEDSKITIPAPENLADLYSAARTAVKTAAGV